MKRWWISLFSLLLMACGGKSDRQAPNSQPTESGLPKTSSKSDFPELFDELRDRTAEWNQALNDRDFNKLGSLYGEKVNLYRDTLNQAVLIDYKKKWLEERPGFEQQLEFESASCPGTEYPPRQVRIDYLKFEITPGDTYDFSGHLIYEKQGKEWKIVDESDWPTDLNRVKPVPLEDGEYCLDAKRLFWEWDNPRMKEPALRTWHCEFNWSEGTATKGVFHYHDSYFDTRHSWAVIGGKPDRWNRLELEVSPINEAGNPTGEKKILTLAPITQDRMVIHPFYFSWPIGSYLLAGECD